MDESINQEAVAYNACLSNNSSANPPNSNDSANPNPPISNNSRSQGSNLWILMIDKSSCWFLIFRYFFLLFNF
ncbi:uncharacterized protein DS421_20g694980 [Arachis hypogaea]|nr:uncharacterized protein DS421_20g694980 [Arachis hypogaea]